MLTPNRLSGSVTGFDPYGTQMGIFLFQILAYFRLFQMWTDE